MLKAQPRFYVFILCFLFVNALNSQDENYLAKMCTPDSLFSEVLSENRDIWIQMPADYRPDNGIKYPVIYLLDGDQQLPFLTAVLNSESPGFIPEMIIVGISNSSHRTLNLTTSEVETSNGWRVEESGGAKDFAQFISQELIPDSGLKA